MVLPRGPNPEVGLQDWTPNNMHHGPSSWHIYVKGIGPQLPNKRRVYYTNENYITWQLGFQHIGLDGQPERIMAIYTDDIGQWRVDGAATRAFLGRRGR